ncbi:hypothetical protein JCM10207_000368 [Rhodosporidiobolus poonsookiae]
MANAKLFTRGKLQELRAELQVDKKDKNLERGRQPSHECMTMGQDLSPLYPDVLTCLSIQVLDIKKMVYLYLINYARVKPEMVKHALGGLLAATNDEDALSAPSPSAPCPASPLPKSSAPCSNRCTICSKTAIQGFIAQLRDLLMDPHSTVIANAFAALVRTMGEVSEYAASSSPGFLQVTDRFLARKWDQTYILKSLMYYVPNEHEDAELLAEQIAIRLQHSNSAVVLSTVKVILCSMNYMGSEQAVEGMCRKLSLPLVTLPSSGYEVQYVALRYIHLSIQRRPSVLTNEVKVIFCKFNDPIYVKMAKLEIIYRLANERNIEQVLAELREYTSEVNVEFVRKSVRTIGRLAIKITSAADLRITVLLALAKTKVSYVVQKAIVIIKDIFQRYPNQYEGIIGTLCEILDALDTPDAEAAMIWIVGQYADPIENSDKLLDDFLFTFLEEPVEVQLALLTATVKLFIKQPTAGQELVPKVLKWATEEVDNPDLRDRGYIYWCLLSTDPAAAQDIVLSDKPTISTKSEAMDLGLLDRLLLHTLTVSSIYTKKAHTFVRGARPKFLHDSPALSQEAKNSYLEALRLPLMPKVSSSSTGVASFSTAAAGLAPPRLTRQDSGDAINGGGAYGRRECRRGRERGRRGGPAR